MAKACEWSGKLSYPVYVVHIPMIFLSAASFDGTCRARILATTVLSIAVAYAIHRTVEPWGRTLIEGLRSRAPTA